MSWGKKKKEIKIKPFRRFDRASYKADISSFEWFVFIMAFGLFIFLLFMIVRGLIFG